MYLETIQTLHRKFWEWLKDQIAQDVPEAEGLCEFDCRKQQCTEEEWASCERRIQKAAGELWPESSPAPRGERKPSAKPSQTARQSPETERENYRPIPVSQSEQEQALARLKCAHCQSLINCEALARAVLAELRRRYRVDCRSSDGGPDVTDTELLEAVREGIDRFLRDSSDSVGGEESRTSAA